MKEFLILLGIAFVLVVIWNLVCWVIEKRFIPKGYKHDEELDALIQDCPSLAHPADSWDSKKAVEPVRTFAYDKLPKSTPKDCKPTIPKGFTKHDGSEKCPIPNAKKYQLMFAEGGILTCRHNEKKPDYWYWGSDAVDLSIIAYRVLSSPKKATTKAKKATKKPAKKVSVKKGRRNV